MTKRSPSSDNEHFETTDLTLAAFLRALGLQSQPKRVGEGQGGRPRGAWVFENTDTLKLLVVEFNGGSASVEPRKFHDCVNQTREQLFDFLGIGRHNQNQ